MHYLKLFIQKNVDGIIFDLYNSDKFLAEFEAVKNFLSIPVVYIECSLNTPDYDVIEADNNYGVDLAIEHLVSLGHKRIGFISEYLSSKVRMPLYFDALKKYGIAVDKKIVKVGSERLEEGGYLRMNELLSESRPPTAVFASYDTMAQGALKAISEHGLKVPEDISIVGFDNIRESAYFSVPLTTVAPPVIDMGEIAVSTLLHKIEKKERSLVQYISLKPRIIVRNSTANVKICG
jgi:DNA-binding LacI/PurR family transcriptional regulator